MLTPTRLALAAALLAVIGVTAVLPAQTAQEPKQEPKKGKAAKKDEAGTKFPPALPGGKDVVTDTSDDFLKPPAKLKDVAVAKAAPTVDFLYFPGQTYKTKLWSNWGDGVAINGKYYTAIGDHDAPVGNAFVFEYDPEKKTLRQLSDLKKILNLPEGHYSPSKIHSRVDMGSDGWLYYSTHRGATNATTEKNHYKGDWIIRTDPVSGKSEVVVQAPVARHTIPNSVLDPDRMIYYGGTASGESTEGGNIQFFAYDVKNHKLLYSGPDGPARYMIFAKSTGKVYYTPGNSTGPLMRYDPAKGGAPEKIAGTIGIRAATQETPQGMVYTVSTGQGRTSNIYSFNTKTEEIQDLGPAAVGSNAYIASIDVDPTGRYLYYVPGAHGGSDVDGSAVIQFDTKTKQKKVIAFLHPFYKEKYGFTPAGTFSTAVDPKGDKMYITWNVNRSNNGKAWDCCGLTTIHIPASERQP